MSHIQVGHALFEQTKLSKKVWTEGTPEFRTERAE